MNKVLLVGRLTRDPDTNSTSTNIKYSRFTVAVSRQFGEDQADFIPIVAWRSTAEFMEKYAKKGAQVSVEGRFTSSTYQNAEGTNITRYEVTADRVELLESRAYREWTEQMKTQEIKAPNNSITATTEMSFIKESIPAETTEMSFVKESTTVETNSTEDKGEDVPWELDL